MGSEKMTSENTPERSNVEDRGPSNTALKKEDGISRRKFVGLAATGLSVGALFAKTVYPAEAQSSNDKTNTKRSAGSASSAEAQQFLSPSPDFMPDWTFKGSSLSDWRPIGAAKWKAENGVITGTPSDAGGGWLLLNKSLQDVQFFTRMQSAGNYNSGVLLRVEKSDTGMSGIFVSLREGDLKSYRLTLDSNGKELQREPLPAGPGEARFAFTAAQPEIPDAKLLKTGEAGGGRQRPAGSDAGYSGPATLRGINLPTPLPELEPPPNGIWKDKWNKVEVIFDADLVRPALNNTAWQMELGATNDASGLRTDRTLRGWDGRSAVQGCLLQGSPARQDRAREGFQQLPDAAA